MLKNLMIAAAFVLSTASAQAVTIDAVEIDASVPQLSAPATLTSNGSGGFSAVGFGVFSFGLPGGPYTATFNSNEGSASLVAFPSGPPGPPITLAGSIEDTQSSAGLIQALYSAAPGPLAGVYDLFLITINLTPGLPFSNFDPLTSAFLAPAPVTLSINAVNEIAPIPLPASLPLLLVGMGSVAMLRRRRRAVR